MIVEITADAEDDLSDGYWFYERQSPGLGTHFLSCLFLDIESLMFYGGIHPMEHGFHRVPSKRFPFCIY